MSKTYYEMLDVSPGASADDIKRAFRREIAKYHPDKVQHLGSEFQSIAAVKAAELTQAYKTLSDQGLRAHYDAQLRSDGPRDFTPPAPHPPPPPPADSEPQRRPAEAAPSPPPAGGGSTISQDRRGASDLVRKAALARFRQAIDQELGRYDEHPAAGFDLACSAKPGFMSRKAPPLILARFMPEIDAAAVADSWALATRIKKDGSRDICVFAMGPTLAPARDLAAAIAEQRRRPLAGGGQLFMVPVNTRTWVAHVPTDAPQVVKTLLGRLRST